VPGLPGPRADCDEERAEHIGRRRVNLVRDLIPNLLCFLQKAVKGILREAKQCEMREYIFSSHRLHLLGFCGDQIWS
jgi:hypothetical protein